MKKKELSDRSDGPCLERKQRPIAATALQNYYERSMTKAIERINVILENLKRRLPEDLKLVRDEPLASESESEPPGFVDASQGPMIRICYVQKGDLKIHIYVVIDGADRLDLVRLVYVSTTGRHAEHLGSLRHIRVNDLLVDGAELIDGMFWELHFRIFREALSAEST